MSQNHQNSEKRAGGEAVVQAVHQLISQSERSTNNRLDALEQRMRAQHDALLAAIAKAS